MTIDNADTQAFNNFRFKATFRGVVLGWYDTETEAFAAIDKAETAALEAEKEWI